MNRYKYFLDFGSGYVEVNPINNNLTISKVRDINPVIVRTKLIGDVSFVGTEYNSIIAYRDSGEKYINIKIQQNVNNIFKDVFIGNASLLTDFDENKKIITLKSFNNSQDYYDNIMNNYNVNYAINDLSLTEYKVKSPSVTSEILYAAKIPNTGLSATDYKSNYSVDGIPYLVPTLQYDTRWNYFLFESTDADGAHNFMTKAFVSDPGGGVGGAGYTKISFKINGKMQTRFVQKPSSTTDTDTATWIYANHAYKISDLLNKLISIINSSLSFSETGITYTGQSDGTVQYAYFDISKLLFSEVADIVSEQSKGSDVSLKKLFELMEKAFDLHWYIEGAALKFKHISELATSGTLDLTNETTHLKRAKYIEAEIPDTEIFRTEDFRGVFYDTYSSDVWGQMQIYYRDSNSQLTNNIVKINEIPINTNVVLMSQNDVDSGKNKFTLLVVNESTGSERTIQGNYPNFNISLSSSNLFAHLNKWRYGDKANLATRLKIALISLIEIKSRPLKKLAPVKYFINDLSTFNLDANVTTSIGDSLIWGVSLKLDNDFAELELRQ